MRSTPGSAPRPTNRLAGETSAYLRQHMHNPVDWHPWTPDALERARREDRPLLVSIGYSACHWCHVMERESFEDPETAALMNRLFVNVKVDREERPDVDQLYMDTVVRLTGHGGWPLTVFCTPEGRPFYGGTYYPPEPAHGQPSFRQVLEAVDRAWRERRAEVEQSAGTILQALRQRPRGVASTLPGGEGLVQAAHALLQGADVEHGGFGGAPKFPMPASLDGLLAALPLLPPEDRRACLSFVVLTCREMARRGLYDQLGGGFHRYCVDAAWTIPHFEKMLYDQGQLLRTYTEAFRLSRDPDLVWPVRETVEYLRREMTAPEGGFFASQDADSEGEEGKYFVWRPQEIASVLGRDRAAAFCAAYGVTEVGNFENGTNHLVDVVRRARSELAGERAELLAARRRRVPPATDTKRVTAWNGLAISGLARAASQLDEADWLGDAAAAADFVLRRMRDAEGRLLRVFADGRAAVSAFLDDHAALLEACLDLHRAGGGERFLAAALGLGEEIARRFFDPDEGELFLTPADGERLPERPRSDADGATPHSAGLAALGLQRLASLAGRRDLEDVVARVIRSHAYAAERVPAAYPTLLRAATLAEQGIAVAVIVGEPSAEDTRALARRAREVLSPEDAVLVAAPGAPPPPGLDPSWLAGREAPGGRATAYLCRGTTCSLPIQEPQALDAAALPGRAG